MLTIRMNEKLRKQNIAKKEEKTKIWAQNNFCKNEKTRGTKWKEEESKKLIYHRMALFFYLRKVCFFNKRKLRLNLFPRDAIFFAFLWNKNQFGYSLGILTPPLFSSLCWHSKQKTCTRKSFFGGDFWGCSLRKDGHTKVHVTYWTVLIMKYITWQCNSFGKICITILVLANNTDRSMVSVHPNKCHFWGVINLGVVVVIITNRFGGAEGLSLLKKKFGVSAFKCAFYSRQQIWGVHFQMWVFFQSPLLQIWGV